MSVRSRSYWVESTPSTGYPALEEDLEVDAAVIGGGIVGITTAWLLQRGGLSVALLDMDRVARGTTGNTTAKLTSGHGTIYQSLQSVHGPEVARRYAEANQAGIEFVAAVVRDTGIACDFQRRDNYVYVEAESAVEKIHAEADACRRAGLPAEVVTEAPLPYRIAAAVKLPDQAQFHPRKYLLGLLELFVDEGGAVFEMTRATEIEEGDRCRVAAGAASVHASHVVVATHYPFIDRAMLFARVHPKRSYVVAGAVSGDRLPDGMFISADEPTRSIRTLIDGDRTLVAVGGEGHPAGQNYDTRTCYDDLQAWAEQRFGMNRIEYRWSAQDGSSVDQLPFVGTYRPGAANVYVATAFGKWGMTNGSAGAKIIADGILGVPNPFADLFDPKRLSLKASARKLLVENARAAAHLLSDRAVHPQRSSLDALGPGEAGVQAGLKPIAAYRDERGALHRVSAVCTHMGCVVSWNSAERTWDCPCHGSRYDIDGRVIEGPATKDLDPL